ncbi:hypothetical protein GN277_11420 [Lachnospiraceae bacterium WCA-9-b2]|jgi:hypothetical protein|uniref:Uncharacterized protein n=1 Tax=Sporofaciens musculi TaxID=2681861 RepID=A0A7X3SJ38_9FIRM|nr:hypothetical protein [Sporofaciens musculi]MXP75970.1 hypothetical protein [Sporofaciens musculi]
MILCEVGGIHIWYLFPCRKQEEQKTLNLCRRCFSQEALQDTFLLTYDCMRRYQGTWHLEKKLIFPANVVLESKNEKLLEYEIRQGRDEIGKSREILKISPDEENFLRFLCGDKKHVGMSRGVIFEGVTKVTEGPLKGLEAQICKIDRHKRLARLETPQGENVRYVLAGLEIMEKVV